MLTLPAPPAPTAPLRGRESARRPDHRRDRHRAFEHVLKTTDMDRIRQQGIGAAIIALVLGLAQLPTLVPVITEPAVSVFDRAYSILILLGASSLFYLGTLRLRNPEWFDDASTEHEFRPVPMAVIAGGLFGIGALMYLIIS